MTKEKFKNLLEFILLLILTVSALQMVWKVITLDTYLVWKQIFALLILAIDVCLFLWRHKTGVVILGITILLALIGLISFSYTISATTRYFGPGDSKIPIFYGQPTFFLLLLISFLISKRHFYQLDTKQYWIDLIAKSSNKTLQ